METVISSLISAAAAIIVCIITGNAQHKQTLATLDKQNALQEYRLKQLEEKMDKHNEVVERTFLLEEKIKVANHRIDDLERKGETHG